MISKLVVVLGVGGGGGGGAMLDPTCPKDMTYFNLVYIFFHFGILSGIHSKYIKGRKIKGQTSTWDQNLKVL